MISGKHDEDPSKKKFQEWAANSQAFGRKPKVFKMPRCRSKEMTDNTDFDSIEKECKYTKEFMDLMKLDGYVNTEEFKSGKEVPEENMKGLLTRCYSLYGCIILWQSRTNRSWRVGYDVARVLLKKGVRPYSNNFTGELRYTDK